MSNVVSRRSLMAGGAAFTFGAVASRGASAATPPSLSLLNVAMGPTRDLYAALNPVFEQQWKARTGQTVTIAVDAGGSGGQAQKVVKGLEPDIMNLALVPDVETVRAATNAFPAGWAARLPNHATPYSSVIVFLVKKGNPLNLTDWDALARPGVKVITSIAKVSGGARWNYLAAWAWARRQRGSTVASAQAYMRALYHNVPAVDGGSAKALSSFATGGVGDVFLAWENEARLAALQFPGKFDIVTPSVTVQAEPPLTLVDKYMDAHGTRVVAQAYAKFLYSPAAQEIIAQNFFRPLDPAVAAKHRSLFPATQAVPVDDALFGGWQKVEIDHFAAGGIFDQITARGG